MASYGDVTVGELLTDRLLRQTIARSLDITEARILRDISGQDEDTALDDIYTPVPASLENLSVSDARGDEQRIQRISQHTGLSVDRVEWQLDNTHGRTLLENHFDFIWLTRPASVRVVSTSAPSQPLQLSPPAVHPASPLPSPSSSPMKTRVAANPSIFGSYSQKDRRFVDALRVHLKPLERENKLEFWDDSKIKAGTKWREEIENAIERASAAILFVSAHFLASDFIYTEEIPPLLAQAERRGTVILPLIVGHCAFTTHPVLSKLQAFNDPTRPLGTLGKNQRDKFFVKIVSELTEVLARARRG